VVDDDAGYKALFASGVIAVGCMAYARCKFFELHEADQSPVACEALQRISELYAIESRGRELANAERQALRECEALPKLQAMQDWLEGTRDTVADGGGLARAIDYSLKRWPALSRFAQSAILPIDNNPVERDPADCPG
jgi:transposase